MGGFHELLSLLLQNLPGSYNAHSNFLFFKILYTKPYHQIHIFLTHPCRRQLLKIFFISNDCGRSLFEDFDWLFICDDPSDVKVVVEIDTP